MNISFECTDLMRGASPGAVHVDRSARPQIVRSTNPSLHRLLSEHMRITGVPSVINTSFNVHEEPIVCTPEDAVAHVRERRPRRPGPGTVPGPPRGLLKHGVPVRYIA